jgi:hypothetical protein
MDHCIKIERDRNGYEVTVTDPKIIEENEKGREGSAVSWKSPHLDYHFKTKDEVMRFIEDVYNDVLPEEKFATAFDKAAEEAKQ